MVETPINQDRQDLKRSQENFFKYIILEYRHTHSETTNVVLSISLGASYNTNALHSAVTKRSQTRRMLRFTNE